MPIKNQLKMNLKKVNINENNWESFWFNFRCMLFYNGLKN